LYRVCHSLLGSGGGCHVVEMEEERQS
jgi:hypothetical protein